MKNNKIIYTQYMLSYTTILFSLYILWCDMSYPENWHPKTTYPNSARDLAWGSASWVAQQQPGRNGAMAHGSGPCKCSWRWWTHWNSGQLHGPPIFRQTQMAQNDRIEINQIITQGLVPVGKGLPHQSCTWTNITCPTRLNGLTTHLRFLRRASKQYGFLLAAWGRYQANPVSMDVWKSYSKACMLPWKIDVSSGFSHLKNGTLLWCLSTGGYHVFLCPGWFTLGAVLKRICRLGISQFRSGSQWQCWKWNSNSTDHGPGIRIKQDNQWLSSMALLMQHSNWMCQSNGAGWGRIHFFAKKKGDGMPPKANAHCSTCCTNSLASNADQTLRLPVQATRKQN